MSKWKLKSCPRCGGDLLIEKDLYGWNEKCFQCSFSRDLKESVKSEKVSDLTDKTETYSK